MRFLSFFNVATSRSREGSPIPPTATMWSISSRHGAPATTRMGLIRASESAATNRNCRNAPARDYGTAVSRWKCSPQAMGSDPERLGGVAVARGEQGRAGGWIHPVVVPVQDAQTLGQSGEAGRRARPEPYAPPPSRSAGPRRDEPCRRPPRPGAAPPGPPREPAPPPPARHAAAPVGPRAGRTTRRPRTPLRARPSPPARPVRRATTEPGLPPMHGTPAPAVPPPPTPSKGRAAPRGACAGRPGRLPAPPAAAAVALRYRRTDDLVPPVARSKL